jgi:hypothetical protein
MFYTRWEIARLLFWIAVKVAPSGPAKSLLLRYLATFNKHILTAINAVEDWK